MASCSNLWSSYIHRSLLNQVRFYYLLSLVSYYLLYSFIMLLRCRQNKLYFLSAFRIKYNRGPKHLSFGYMAHFSKFLVTCTTVIPWHHVQTGSLQTDFSLYQNRLAWLHILFLTAKYSMASYHRERYFSCGYS